eukprot:6025494-Amphidinium_carterae.1
MKSPALVEAFLSGCRWTEHIQQSHTRGAARESYHCMMSSCGFHNSVEVILDQELLVMYKPPFWKCELPEGTSGL